VSIQKIDYCSEIAFKGLWSQAICFTKIVLLKHH